jgi:hypothetical protein
MTIDQIRAERNARLQESDKYVLPDFPHTSTQNRARWIHYRQKLRDMMADVEIQVGGDPTLATNVVFPTSPSKVDES